MKIKIVGLHKVDVLYALYISASKKNPFQRSIQLLTPRTSTSLMHDPKTVAKAALSEIETRKKTKEFFINGVNLGEGVRYLAVDLTSDDEFDATDYDKMHGKGAARAAIAKLENSKAQLSRYADTSFSKILASRSYSTSTCENDDSFSHKIKTSSAPF